MYVRQYESDESESECASRLPLACELNFSQVLTAALCHLSIQLVRNTCSMDMSV